MSAIVLLKGQIEFDADKFVKLMQQEGYSSALTGPKAEEYAKQFIWALDQSLKVVKR